MQTNIRKLLHKDVLTTIIRDIMTKLAIPAAIAIYSNTSYWAALGSACRYKTAKKTYFLITF